MLFRNCMRIAPALFLAALLLAGPALHAQGAAVEAEIREDVNDQLFWDDRVNSQNVNVLVNDGRVTLRGTVSNYSAFDAAEQNAWKVPGVISVDNDLAVEYPASLEVPEDQKIATRIENSLLWNSNLESADIDVSVKNGMVDLEGSVDAYWKKERAEDIAARQRGVVLIENELAVVPTEDITDEAIARDITQALERSDAVSVENVDVKVTNATVTLTGEVSDWMARQAAAEAARFTLGVVEVDNLLVIER